MEDNCYFIVLRIKRVMFTLVLENQTESLIVKRVRRKRRQRFFQYLGTTQVTNLCHRFGAKNLKKGKISRFQHSTVR